MKVTIKNYIFLILISSLIFSTSCKKSNGGLIPEEITTLEITFTNSGDLIEKVAVEDLGTVFSYKVIQGQDPVVTSTGSLIEKKVYNYSIRILNEANELSIVDLSSEIIDEAEAHLFCFQESTTVDQVSVVKNKDSNGNDFGMSGTMNFTNKGNYGFRILLKHEANKSSSNPCSTGNTDIDASFNINVTEN